MSLTDTADPALPDAPLLRLFDVLFTTHSVTRTAEQLGLSQPTVSIWLAKLRTQLHDPLFVRTSSGMQPTPRARELIAPAREALAALRRLSAQPEPFDPAQSTRRFRLCMTEAGQLTLLPMLAAHVRALAPGVSLETGPVDAQTADALAAGDADLALGFVPWLEAGLYQQALFAQDWVCLVHPHHPRVVIASPRGRRLQQGNFPCFNVYHLISLPWLREWSRTRQKPHRTTRSKSIVWRRAAACSSQPRLFSMIGGRSTARCAMSPTRAPNCWWAALTPCRTVSAC